MRHLVVVLFILLLGCTEQTNVTLAQPYCTAGGGGEAGAADSTLAAAVTASSGGAGGVVSTASTSETTGETTASAGGAASVTTEATAATGGGGAPPGPPNILLIIVDDWGAESSSLYPALNGATGAVSMPNIEALAAGGLVFDTAWASPLCSPTRSTIASGRYTHHTGVTNTSEGAVLPVDTVTLWDRLTADTNYGQGFFGKYHLGGKNLSSTDHIAAIGVPLFRGILWNLDNQYDWSTYSLHAAPQANTGYYTSTAFTDYAIEFIDAHESESPNDPWFVWQAYTAAHSPYQVPPAGTHSVDLGGAMPGTTLSTLDNYKAILQSLDTNIGRLLAEVDLEDTTVIVIGDNGTPSAMKDSMAKLKLSKDSIYEGGLRVPLVIAGAGVTRQGREDALVNSPDLYATILELAGLPVSQVYNSYSLVPLLSDENASTGRTHSFAEKSAPGGAGHQFAIRDARYKLGYGPASTWFLYDLWNSPKETSNHYGGMAYATQQASLQAALDEIAADAPAGYFP